MTGDATAPKSFAAHIRSTLTFGAPLVAAQLSFMLIGVTDTVMVGWLGTNELAAATLAFQTLFICSIIGIGFGAAMMPLISEALGRENEFGVRRTTRMGLWALVALALLLIAPLTFTETLLLALGQEPQLAGLAQDYMRIAQFSLLPFFLVTGFRAFLTATERPNAVLMLTIATAVVNAAMNYAFIFGNFGAPRLEIEGAAVATVLSNSFGALAVLAYVRWLPEARRYTLFARIWRPDWVALRQIVSLGFPISLTILAEVGLFSAASIMIGWIGTLELAAHGIALQVASLAFMVPLGLSQASSVRVGRALGTGNATDIGRAGRAALLLAIAFAVLSAIVMIAIPEILVRPFFDPDRVDEVALTTIAVPLLWMAAAFQLADSAQAVGAGNLRGLQDTKVPLLIATIAYWPVGIGAAWWLAFPLGFGAVGVWGGLALGLAVAGIFLNLRFARRERLGLVASR